MNEGNWMCNDWSDKGSNRNPLRNSMPRNHVDLFKNDESECSFYKYVYYFQLIISQLNIN